MDIKLIEKNREKKTLVFLWKKISIEFANSVRRAILEKVPTMAIEEVEFKKNTSALYDEMIAHRLGMMPIKTDLKSYVLPEKCKCEGAGCARCMLKLSLNAKSAGPVTASKIKSEDPKVGIVYDDMPIVKLIEEQKLQLEATATLGTGEKHAKFSPGLAFYKHAPVIEVLKNPNNPEEIAAICPQGIYEAKGDKLNKIKDKVNDCHLCLACVDKAGNKVISIEPDTESIIFTVESFGQLEPKEMLVQASEALGEELEMFAEKIKELKEE